MPENKFPRTRELEFLAKIFTGVAEKAFFLSKRRVYKYESTGVKLQEKKKRVKLRNIT